jgi:hypothetical protein
MPVVAPAYSTNQVGIPYLTWQPTAAEQFYVPAGQPNLPAPVPITVGASPFSFTNPTGTGCTVLIGGGKVSNVSISGTYPPSAPGGWNTPPSGTFQIGLGGGANDSTFNLLPNQTLVVTYSVAPQMYYAVP